MTANRAAGLSRKLAAVSLSALVAVTGSLLLARSAQAATSAEASAASATLALLNNERAANHLPLLAASTALVSSARRHNLAMAAANTLSHQLPGEPVFSTRISQAGVVWHSVAENIGYTTDRSAAGSQSLETSMYNEVAPNNGHRLNILSSSVRYVGVDVLIDARTGKLWLTEDFADAPGPLTPAAAPVSQAQLAHHNPFGGMSVTASRELTGHRFHIVGWAIDPDNKFQPLYISVWSDGHFVARVAAPSSRGDIAAAFRAGWFQGFDFAVPVPTGRHTIQVFATNIGLGTSATLMGTRTWIW
ncbi:MAG TPA: CAP domain-containing protein [Jatrophihabitans sp.]|nr:CAP domain-containing protein [Jatrophihabitans sp.]